MIISRESVADDFGENVRAARLRILEILEREDRRSLGEYEPGAAAVEGAALLRRRSLQRIEADKDELRKRIVAARENTPISTRAYAFECVTDCVRAGGTRVRDHLARSG